MTWGLPLHFCDVIIFQDDCNTPCVLSLLIQDYLHSLQEDPLHSSSPSVLTNWTLWYASQISYFQHPISPLSWGNPMATSVYSAIIQLPSDVACNLAD